MNIRIIGETPPLSPPCPSLGEVCDFVVIPLQFSTNRKKIALELGQIFAFNRNIEIGHLLSFKIKTFTQYPQVFKSKIKRIILPNLSSAKLD